MGQLVEMTSKNKPLSDFVVNVRKSRGISTRELGKMIGVSGPYVSLVENQGVSMALQFASKLMPMLTIKEKEQLYKLMLAELQKELNYDPT